MRVRRLSARQLKALEVMGELGEIVTAREVAARSGQSSDGAACTLRSLVDRGLVEHTGHNGDRYGYRLTDEGKAANDTDPARR